MAVLLVSPEQQFSDADGHPYAGGQLFTYITGTTTPKLTWSDIGGTAANTNPIILDAAGRAVIFGDGDYRMVLLDAQSNPIWDQSASTVISAAMQPVVSGSIANAQTLLGIDPTLGAQLAAEAAARIAADSAEATARAAADAAEAATRLANDTNLQGQITAEAAARAAADAHLQSEIDALVAAPTSSIRAGTVTIGLTGDFTLTFSPAFTTGVAQIWVGYPPGVGEPTSGSPANPVSFPHITTFSTSGCTGVLLDNTFTPLNGSMRWWAIGFSLVITILGGTGVA